jgi:hypothetical protein
MAGQGIPATPREIERIIRLLSSSDLSISDIATRVGRSRALIISINQRYSVRRYKGRRGTWVVEKTYLADSLSKTKANIEKR